MRKRVCLVSSLVLCAAACGDKPAATPAATKPDAQAIRAELAKREGEPSAALPAGLKGRLAFAATVLDDGRLVALAPKDWKESSIPGSLRPPEGSDLGFMSQFAVTTNCDGECTAKDWPTVADKVDLAQLRGADFTVVKDEAQPDGRLLVARTLDRTYVVLVRWQTGASRYAVCRATLDQELAEAAPAFEAACKSLQVVSWN
jgi:hypothetical protein